MANQTAVIFITDPTGGNNPFLKIKTGGHFVIGSIGQQLGPGDYYTSVDGITWVSHIGELSVAGASFGDGVSQGFTSDGQNFIIGFSGAGNYGGAASEKTQFLVSHDSASTFSLSSMSGFGDGTNSPVLGTLFNYYDLMPNSGNPGFRLALENQGLTQIVYQSSYDGGKTWTTDQTLSPPQNTSSAPAFWGPQPISDYVKGTFNGQNFYVSRITVAGNVGIYGGITRPTPPILTVPDGWNLLFTPVNGSGFGETFQLGATNSANTTFVINDSIKQSPMIAVGTGDPATWQELTLAGSLGVISGASGDLSTLVYS